MIYVHVPFCGSFCTYCDFYSELACGGKDFEKYADALCAEIDSRKEEIKASQGVDTLYIGGGTPSVLPLSVLERIVSKIVSVAHSDGSSFDEFTVEVNPEDIVTKGLDYARGLRALGVSRVSMGVQSLSDEMLRWMNRRHCAEGALEAYGILRQAGFDNISLDLISGISHLSEDMLRSTVRKFIELAPEHISAYQLSIEEGSALSKLVERGDYVEADEELCRSQYLLVCDMLREAGYEHYEISNWARPGFRAKHNSAYWTRAPYVGLGPGAHSLRRCVPGGDSLPQQSLTPDSLAKSGMAPGEDPADDVCRDIRSWNSSESPLEWTSSEEILSPKEIREEKIMLGLRTAAGWNGRTLTEPEWFISDSIIAEYF